MAGKRAINGCGVLGRRIGVLDSQELLEPTLTRELMRAVTSQILNKSTAKSVVAFCNKNPKKNTISCLPNKSEALR